MLRTTRILSGLRAGHCGLLIENCGHASGEASSPNAGARTENAC